jgi:hypothetical protein
MLTATIATRRILFSPAVTTSLVALKTVTFNFFGSRCKRALKFRKGNKALGVVAGLSADSRPLSAKALVL